MTERLDRMREQSQEAVKAQAIEAHKRRLLYHACFDTDAGRQVLLDIMTRSYLFSTTFTGNSQTYFNEGAREWALELMRVIPGLVGAVINTHFRGVEAELTKETQTSEAL